MAVVESDVKGIRLFLSELQKGQENQRANREEARQIQQQKIKNDVTLGQMGLQINPDGNLSKLSNENNLVLQGNQAIEKASSIAKVNLQNAIRGIQTGQQVDFLQSEGFKDLQNINDSLKLESDKKAREKKTLDLEAQVASEVKVKESETGEKLSDFEINEVREKSVARTAGLVEGRALGELTAPVQEREAQDRELRIGTQVSSLELVSKLTGKDLTDEIASVKEGNLIPDDIISFVTRNALATSASNQKVDTEKKALVADIKKIAKSSGIDPEKLDIDENTSKEVLKSLVRNLMKPGEKPKAVTPTEFNRFNSDITKVTTTRDSIGSIQGFLNKIEKGAGFVSDDDIEIPAKIRGLFPKLFGKTTALDAGDTEMINNLKAELENLKTEYSSAANSLENRSKRDPTFKDKFDSLIKQNIILKKKKK